MSLEKTSMIIVAGLVGAAGMATAGYAVFTHGKQKQIFSASSSSYQGVMAATTNKAVLGEQVNLKPSAAVSAASEIYESKKAPEAVTPTSSVNQFPDPANKQSR